MRKSRFTEKRTVGILAERERGEATAEVCRRRESEANRRPARWIDRPPNDTDLLPEKCPFLK